MRSFHCKHSLLAAICLLAATSMSEAMTVTEAVQMQPENAFYNSGAEGWYWYKDPLPEEIQPETIPEPPVPDEVPPEKEKAPQKPVEQGPTPFTLKWVQEMLPKYQERAWDDPSPENVQAYFLVQRFAMDRANKFADVAQQVVIGNTLLDETMRRPSASFANTYIERASARNADALLQKVAEKAGIFFFFRSDCRYCEAQAPLLGIFEKLGFEILAVSLDGGELQSRKFANTHVDTGQAQQLGVQSTPAIFLMNEDGKFSAIGQTVMSYSDLRRRILIVALREGWVTEEEFRETQPYLNPNDQHDLSEELPRLIKTSADPMSLFSTELQAEKLAAMSAEDKDRLAAGSSFIEPQKLIALFGKAAQTNGQFDPEADTDSGDLNDEDTD